MVEAAHLAVGRRSAEDERVAAGAVRHAQLPNAIGQHLEGEGGVSLPPRHLLLLLPFHHLQHRLQEVGVRVLYGGPRTAAQLLEDASTPGHRPCSLVAVVPEAVVDAVRPEELHQVTGDEGAGVAAAVGCQPCRHRLKGGRQGADDGARRAEDLAAGGAGHALAGTL